jgi:hypothetical protein
MAQVCLTVLIGNYVRFPTVEYISDNVRGAVQDIVLVLRQTMSIYIGRQMVTLFDLRFPIVGSLTSAATSRLLLAISLHPDLST